MPTRKGEVVLGRGDLARLAEERTTAGGWLCGESVEDRIATTREMCFILLEQLNALRRPDPKKRKGRR